MNSSGKRKNVSLVRTNERIEEEERLFLTFMLAAEVYGIEIMAIKEIIEYSELTFVPMVPKYIRGIINIRGNVVPVIELSSRLGQQGQPSEVSRRTCIVIVEVAYEDEMIDIGIMVDAVNEVLEIAAENIGPAPIFGANIRTDFISGMGNVDDKFVVLLNIDFVLSIEELSAIDQVAQGETSAAEGAGPQAVEEDDDNGK